MALLFWTSSAIVLYVYAAYPLLLHVWARVRPRPIQPGRASRPMPGVSIVIAARNEGHRLAGRLENLLQLDYPRERLQVVVVSDGSTDESLAVLARYHDAVDCVAAKPNGKASALNLGVAYARHDVLVFADTRQAFAPDALRELVAPFADPRVGGVTGELLLDGERGDRRRTRDRRSGVAGVRQGGNRRTRPDRRRAAASTIADGVGLYWRYEKRIRRDESAVGSTLGATGAIYALRRRLWRPLPAGTILDDVLAPMRAVMAGYRIVFNDRARAYDRPSPDARIEGRRKRRTLAGNYQLLWLEPALLLPWRNPAWLPFVSHKLGRLLVPYALGAVLISSLALAGTSPLYAAAVAGQAAFYGLAAYGAWLERHPTGAIGPFRPQPSARAARVALMFLVMNGSAVAGLGALLLGRKVWR
jgi:poly-beta-1,6-N-acetyl-D-glucosamine synthase